ncbi:MAG: amidohydrolase family protein [Chloroflexi bacterium]|nr:amidohydrolase family protein [Chloroflexota bacterium]
MSAAFFSNARIVTMDPRRPRAESLHVRDGAVVSCDPAGAPADAATYDCGGALLLPAFIDAHCHVLAAAAALRSVDCTARAAPSISDIQSRLRKAAAEAREGAWIRAYGYDESRLAERRHPNCRDLDDAVPHLPVRLLHRGGHAVVLNTRAMLLAGIAIDTEEPPGGCIERFHDSGEPSGLLLEMNDVVDRVVPPLPYADLAGAVEDVSRRFIASGVTAVVDATHTNGAREWETCARLQNGGYLPLDVTLMEGLAHAGEMPGSPRARLRRGHVKIMLSEVGGGLAPAEATLRRAVLAMHRAGRGVAIHAVEERAVGAAIDAIEAAVGDAGTPEVGHRIEHAGLLPPGAAERLARLGVCVVTQPAFVHEQGDRYLEQVPREKHTRLYPWGDLLRADVCVAASSDAPVSSIGVPAALRAAMDRGTEAGAVLGAGQAVSFEQAAAMWTRDAARAAGYPDRGAISPGLVAAFVLRDDRDGGLRVLETYVRGERVYAAG